MPSPNHHIEASRDPIAEIVDLLATACLRHRKREAAKWVKEKTEKTLDDVAQRGKLRTTENRTPEKGA